MVKRLIIFIVFFLISAPAFGVVELDGDSNGGVDISKGGTNATTEDGARTSLGLAIGTDVLAPDGDGGSLTNLDGENIQDDSIDDDSIDFSDVTLLDFGLAETHDTAGELDALYEGELDNSAGLASAISDETGTGSVVFSTSPTLVTPILGTITSGVGTALTALNGENIQDDTIDDDSIDFSDVTLEDFGLATTHDTAGELDALYEAELDNSAGLAAALSDETGTGSSVFSTSPTLVTPILGTITSGVGTALTALNGENIQDDTIDDDSIDFSDVTIADLTMDITCSGLPTTGNWTLASGAWDLSSLTSLILPAWQNGATSSGYTVFLEDSDNGTNKVSLYAPASITSDYTLVLPEDDNGILQTEDTTATLTNKTINYTSNVIVIPYEVGVAASDETTDLTTGASKVTFRVPYALTLLDVRANVNTAPVGSTIIVDINEGGTTILSTKLTIDASEKTSTTAATPAVISDSSVADDGEITIDIDQIGSSTAGKGLKIWLIGTRSL